MMHKMTLTQSDFSEGLVSTYENIARKDGYPVTDNTTYDCRKLDVADNIQEAWIGFYQNRTKSEHPHLSEYEIKQNIMALLLNCGAKVSPLLSDNEVLIHPGFASEAA
ncbi:MAG: hypothetical protein IJ682_04035 [Lachnospiraceae bacterium]|nr:hypothetical protein [Lachnospiraceae bacterium]